MDPFAMDSKPSATSLNLMDAPVPNPVSSSAGLGPGLGGSLASGSSGPGLMGGMGS